MEVGEFRKELLESIRSAAEAYSDTPLVRFVVDAGTRLTDAEEFSDFADCHFEGEGTRRRKLLVDGYAFDEADNSMILVVAAFSGEDETPSLDATEVKRYFAMLRAFIEDSLSAKLTDGDELSIEETEPGFGLASDLQAWRNKIDRFRLYLITDAELAMRAREFPDGEIDGVSTEFNVWDIVRFHRAHESATGRDDLLVDFEKHGGGLRFLRAGGAEGEYEAYLCMIPGAVLASIYDRYGSRLLEGNIRSFLSLRGDVNKKMKITIQTKPEMFFAYNNGISATSEAVEIAEGDDGPEIRAATNLQIVNGGQTTASLALALRGKVDLTKIHVQMKLSVLPPEKAADLIPDIARYANSQNKVSEADFFSNHAYHVRLEEFSRRLWAPATGGAQHQTHWFYERARGQYLNEQSKMSRPEKKRFVLQNPRNQVLTKTDVAKIENTWRCLPHKVSLGSQKNFRDFAGWISQRWEQNDVEFNEEYFRRLISLAIMFRQTEKYVSEQPWYHAGGYRAALVTYSIAKLNLMIQQKGRGRVIDLRRIWDRQVTSAELLRQIGTIAQAIDGILTAPDRPKENVTEWAKLPACWVRVQDLELELNEDVISRLVGANVIAQEQRQARNQQIQDDAITVQAGVVGISADKWRRVRRWGEERRLLTPKESSLLSVAALMPARLPTEKQCELIWAIREKLANEGCPELL